MQGKRGVEKPPFQLPDFIAATGISKMRQSIQDKDNAKGAKQKGREKTQPKMHRLEIDYQVLHDAFFKYQTKPKLTIHGDLYYEGKEFELTLKEKRPGVISDDLKVISTKSHHIYFLKISILDSIRSTIPNTLFREPLVCQKEHLHHG